MWLVIHGSVPPAFGNAFRNDYSFGEQTARIAIFDNELISIETPDGIKKFRKAPDLSLQNQVTSGSSIFPCCVEMKKPFYPSPIQPSSQKTWRVNILAMKTP